MEDLCRIYERFMEDLWKIYGGLIEALWRIYDGFPPQGCFFLVAAPLGLGFVSYGFLTDIRHVFMMDLWMIYEGFIDDFWGFMEDLWRIYGGFRGIYGGFMEDLWRIYGGFMEDL